MASGSTSGAHPGQLARLLATRRSTGSSSIFGTEPFGGVLFTYVDNSNVWIEGGRIQAVRRGLAKDPADAARREISSPWSYDFGHLYELVCPPGTMIGHSLLVGSRPPPNDSLWDRARDEGFEVDVFDRNVAGREKQVDSHIVTTMLDDSYQYMKSERGDIAVLVAGDGDYVPSIRSLQRRQLRVRVMFWKHATSRELREACDKFIELDPYFDRLTLPPTARNQ